MSRMKPRPPADSILFVGDIQGCLDPLERLLQAADYSPDRHRLIPVGDTINRGYDNVAVLSLLRDLGADPIIGNHELKLLSRIDKLGSDKWFNRQTIRHDLLRDPRLDTWLDWMTRWPSWHEGKDWLCVHAGLHPRRPIEETSRWYLATVRICDAQGNQPKDWDGLNHTFPPGFHPWHHYYSDERLVVYGHWARQGFHRTWNTLGLDDGCVYGGTLVGWWYPDDRIVRVPGMRQGRAD